MSFISEVPEFLEDSVILDKGLYQPIVIRREQTGKTIGLSGAVKQCPFGARIWAEGYPWLVVCLCEVENVGFMVKHQPRAAFVIPINIVDTVSWKEKNTFFFSFVVCSV